MILGTSKISLFFGPINGQILAPWPRIYVLYSTKIPQRILKYMGSPWKNIIFTYMRINKIENVRIMCVPNFLNFWNFEISKFWSFESYELLNFWNLDFLNIKMIIYFKNSFVEMRTGKWLIFPLIKCTKAWIWISYLSKNMKCEFGNFSIFR